MPPNCPQKGVSAVERGWFEGWEKKLKSYTACLLCGASLSRAAEQTNAGRRTEQAQKEGELKIDVGFFESIFREADGVDIRLLAIVYARTKDGTARRFNFRDLGRIVGVASWDTVSRRVGRMIRAGVFEAVPEVGGIRVSERAREMIE